MGSGNPSFADLRALAQKAGWLRVIWACLCDAKAFFLNWRNDRWIRRCVRDFAESGVLDDQSKWVDVTGWTEEDWRRSFEKERAE